MEKTKHMVHEKHYRKLEELNLIDNFLFQEMISQEGVGEEFARLLLRTILGKEIRNVRVVPQKSVPGIDTDRHGIRLDAYIEAVSEETPLVGTEAFNAEVRTDIYDIEPNNSYEKNSLPRRMRYYHALIDTQVLASGTDYENLQNIIIIVILPYDPFDKNRMVYTIQNQCLEDSTLAYEDGARKIFLYTKGTEGNPSQELKDMLKFIERTTAENVTNQTIAAVNDLVMKVKHSREVGINYMKSWEYEKMITERATREGLQSGMEQGLQQGIEQGLQAFIALCKEMNLSLEETLAKIISRFDLSEEKAQTYMDKYW